jgi:hypothetical protein
MTSQPQPRQGKPEYRLFQISPRMAVTFTVLALSERDAASIVISEHGLDALGDGEFREIPMKPGIVAEAWE